MTSRPVERVSEGSERSTRQLVSSAQDVAERAGAYVQARMTRASERAQDLAQDASDRVERLTGQSVESWIADARSFVRDRPLRAVVITVAIGFVLGKLVTRGPR
jgi:ElaB/YqjD/DUF883 family membrane-anchored ribosome-binding protein